MNSERQRLKETKAGGKHWKLWGPYLSERQWGTVREDYSPHGDAWEYSTHDQARSRAYRWGEDGIAGFSDDQARLCLSLALWNGRDPILKERFFGLTNGEGNHGEDVKELYYYLDATPTHSWLQMLYKYPQAEFPYARLIEENHRRNREQPEFELLDTGIFDDNRYFDVFVEYAKADAEDILMRITVHNRGPEAAEIHLLPQLWFRNTWSWKLDSAKPVLREESGGITAQHPELGEYRLHVSPHLRAENYPKSPRIEPLNGARSIAPRSDGGLTGGAMLRAPVQGEGTATSDTQKSQSSPSSRQTEDNSPSPGGEGWGKGERRPTLLFCDNETNVGRLYGQTGAKGFFKDAFSEYVIHGNQEAVNSQQTGTKAGALYRITVAAGSSVNVKLRLYKASQTQSVSNFEEFDAIVEKRRSEADEFYSELQKEISDPDQRQVQRQAFAGLIWSKQFYYYDVREWLAGDPAQPPPPSERNSGRNHDWTHLNNADVISMPDKWEYPWYAAWDLAFHCIPLALLDAEFAKHQLVLLAREWYMHPNGQFPAYEWDFGDVNPPVHAWAAWRVFQIDRKQRRQTDPNDPGDLLFLERVYHKLLLNFTWWVNRKDAQGRNIFQGGFLGFDNIGVFDRSAPLPTGGFLNQADGTSWMAMYSLNLMRIALELALHDKAYEDIATKFFEHFLAIAAAINAGKDHLGLWDEQEEFYYDELQLPDGREIPLRIRSMVGLVPLFAVEVLDPVLLKRLPGFTARMKWYLNYRPDLARLVSHWHVCGRGDRQLLSLLRGHRMKCLLRRMLDETEFLSEFGVRALSKAHEREPYRLDCGGVTNEVFYWPAESHSALFGGNSNWRGPIWMPVNYLIIESLQKFHYYYGDEFKIECPTGSGKMVTLNDVADELSRRLAKLFLKGEDGQRPVLKYHPKLATDPQFRDYVLFHEYFHGDTGRGVGASHQTGWTGLVAKLLQPRRREMQIPEPEPGRERTGSPQPAVPV